MATSDASLVRLAQRGDPEAFSRLVERHWSRLVGYARSVLGDGDAEDAVQDGLVIVWDKLGTLQDPEALAAWTLRIVGRLCFRRARFRQRFVSLDARPDPRDPAPEAAAQALEVKQTLALLAPRQRAVMHLTIVEGMSDSEIGTVLEIDAASVRSHRRRARERLREQLRCPASGGGE